MEIINTNSVDFISCTSFSRKNISINSQIYSNGDSLLNDLGWHLTMTGITIYKRKSLLLEHFNTALYPNFPQFALIFSTFNNKNVKLYWLNDRLIFGSGKKKSYWLDNFMNVFIDDFRKTINNLPQNFNTETVDRVIRTHSVNTGILRYYKFINLRIENKWNYKLLKSRLSDIKKYSDLNIFILISLTLIPPKLLNFLYKIKTK